MPRKSNNQRLLLYVPVMHSREDMGIFGVNLPNPGVDFQMRSEYWRSLADKLKNLSLKWNTFKVYQDGLPDTDLWIVNQIIEKVQSPNFELLRWMISQGATVLGAESSALLKQEHDYIAAIFSANTSVALKSARREYASHAAALLKSRDQYVASRIDASLTPRDVGLLFIGKAHHVAQELPEDILVMRIDVEAEHRLRLEIEERDHHLEQRIREIMALNRLFQ